MKDTEKLIKGGKLGVKQCRERLKHGVNCRGSRLGREQEGSKGGTCYG